MAYDEGLAERIRNALGRRKGLEERRMFGGLAFMLDGKMCCGVLKDDLMLRLGPENSLKALAKHHVRPMDFTGRPLTGFVYVSPAGYAGQALAGWLKQAVAFVRSLPTKPGRTA